MIYHRQHKLIDESSDYLSTTPQFTADKIDTWLSAVLQSTMDGIIVIDTSGQIVVLNRKASRIFGYSERQMLDHPMEMLLPVRLRPNISSK
jgi:PAS domain S-box-containing protein